MTQQTISPGAPDISRDEFERLMSALDQPGWLRERRIEAWRQYESMDLPDPYDEEWRRTDVRAEDFSAYRPSWALNFEFEDRSRRLEEERANNPSSVPVFEMLRGGKFRWSTKWLPLSSTGFHADVRRDAASELMRRGLVATDLANAAREHGDLVRKHLYSTVGVDEWKYLALNAAAWTAGYFVYVPKGLEVSVPLHLIEGLTESPDPHAEVTFPRVLIVAEPHSRVTVIREQSSGEPAPRALVSGAVEIIVGDNAKVEYCDINRYADNVYNFNTVRAVLGRDAEFVATVAGIGSKLTKMRIDAEMPQPGARADLLGVTFGSGDQHFDYNTRQEHTGDHTVSDLRFKSALTDRSSLVWYGVTRINPSAAGSEASQTSRNLLLSEHAKAAPIPILEIEAYDVAKCSHGATAGPVDEEELFYLQSHGIDRDTSERMLVEGFFADVIDRVPDAALREHIMDAVLAKVGGPADGTITFDEVMGAPA